jgi:hypothetical protein
LAIPSTVIAPFQQKHGQAQFTELTADSIDLNGVPKEPVCADRGGMGIFRLWVRDPKRANTGSVIQCDPDVVDGTAFTQAGIFGGWVTERSLRFPSGLIVEAGSRVSALVASSADAKCDEASEHERCRNQKVNENRYELNGEATTPTRLELLLSNETPKQKQRNPDRIDRGEETKIEHHGLGLSLRSAFWIRDQSMAGPGSILLRCT